MAPLATGRSRRENGINVMGSGCFPAGRAGLGWLARGRARACFPAGRAGLAGPAGLIKVAKKVWRAITPEYLENHYDGMPRRMAAVIAAGGRHTKY